MDTIYGPFSDSPYLMWFDCIIADHYNMSTSQA